MILIDNPRLCRLRYQDAPFSFCVRLPEDGAQEIVLCLQVLVVGYVGRLSDHSRESRRDVANLSAVLRMAISSSNKADGSRLSGYLMVTTFFRCLQSPAHDFPVIGTVGLGARSVGRGNALRLI